MTKPTEHHWQQTYSRLRDWLLKYHPEVYKEFQKRRGRKPGFSFVPVDLSKIDVRELAENADEFAEGNRP